MCTQPMVTTLRPIGSVKFIFDRPMYQSSFSLVDDIVSFTGPQVALVATGYSWTDEYMLEVSFDSQAAIGSYELVIGPGILDLQGTPLDQKGDGLGGQADDLYAATVDLVGPPDLVVVEATAPASAMPGEQVEVSWTITNQGHGDALANWYNYLYISDVQVWGSSDTYVYGERIGEQTPLAPGSSYTITQTVTVPSIGLGDSYLLIVADASHRQGEMEEANNVYALPIAIVAPDLVVSWVTAPSSAVLGEQVEVSWTVRNQREVPASADWYDRLYVSDDMIYGYGDTYVHGEWIWDQTPLAAGDSYTITQTVAIPDSTLGSRYLLFVTDAGNSQGETDESNNVNAVSIMLYAPDLVVSAASSPASAVLGETITVSWMVTNQGSVYAPVDWYNSVYVSMDPVLSADDTYINAK